MFTVTNKSKEIINAYRSSTLPLSPDFLMNSGFLGSAASSKKWIREQGVSLFERAVSLSKKDTLCSGVSFFNGSTTGIPQGIFFRKEGQRGNSSKALTWRGSEEQVLADLESIYPKKQITLISPTPALNEKEHVEPIVIQPEISPRNTPLTLQQRLTEPITPDLLEVAEKASKDTIWDAKGLVRQIKIQPKSMYCPECEVKGCPVPFHRCHKCEHHSNCSMYQLGLMLQP